MLRELLTELTKDAPISVAEYVRLCLYHPQFGYYTSPRERVGERGDFYTASTLKGAVFSRLLLKSAQKLCGGADSKIFDLVEIGAEPERSLFENSKVIRVGEEIKLSGNLFVFSNELLDAQPFDRFKFENGKILKTFVRFDSAGGHEISYQEVDEKERVHLEKYFEFNHKIFYLDFSFAALELLKNICSQDWCGALVFADYFRTRAELSDFHKGTARTYKNHKAYADIFENPGEEDITFSPPFEDFLEILNQYGFTNCMCETQANFFFNNAQEEIKNIIETRSLLSPEKRALSEILSPTYFGELFRVIAACR